MLRLVRVITPSPWFRGGSPPLIALTLVLSLCRPPIAQPRPNSPIADGPWSDTSSTELASEVFRVEDLPADYTSPDVGGTDWTVLFPTLTSASSYATQTFGVTSNIAGEDPGAAGVFLMPSYQQARSSFQDVLNEYRYRRE